MRVHMLQLKRTNIRTLLHDDKCTLISNMHHNTEYCLPLLHTKIVQLIVHYDNELEHCTQN